MESKDQKINQELNSWGELSWVLNPPGSPGWVLRVSGWLCFYFPYDGFVFIFFVMALFLFSSWWLCFYFPHNGFGFIFPRKNRCLLSTASAWAGTKHSLHCYCWPCSTHLGCIYWLLRSCKGLQQSEYLIFLSHVLIKGLQRAREHLLPQPCLWRPLAKLNKRALHLLLVWFFCNAFYYLFEGVN